MTIAEAQEKNESLVNMAEEAMAQVEFRIQKQEIKPLLKEGETRPLPTNRSLVVKDYWKRKYEGLLTPDHVLQFYNLRVNSPSKYHPEGLAAIFNIELDVVQNMLKYYASPAKVTINGEKCAVWPAEAQEVLIIQSTMKKAFGKDPSLDITKAELLQYRGELEQMKQTSFKENRKKEEMGSSTKSDS